MTSIDILTNLGYVLGGIFAVMIAYHTKKPPAATVQQDPILAGVGLEFGNRLQSDAMVAELKRIADYLAVLADRKQAGIDAKLDRILQEMEEREEEARRR